MHEKGNLDNLTKTFEIIIDYNSKKDGVDMVDKIYATYTVPRITKR